MHPSGSYAVTRTTLTGRDKMRCRADPQREVGVLSIRGREAAARNLQNALEMQ